MSTAKQSRKRFIEFTDQHGIYRNMQLGRIGTAESNRALRHVKHLVWAKAENLPCRPETQRWLNEDGSRYACQLAKLGLVTVCAS